MGFDSINGFESKVSGGNGEQVMSRDVLRMASHLDFFRLLSFYSSGERAARSWQNAAEQPQGVHSSNSCSYWPSALRHSTVGEARVHA